MPKFRSFCNKKQSKTIQRKKKQKLCFDKSFDQLFIFFIFFSTEPPSCADNVKSLATVNNTSVLLPCLVRGYPIPTVKWQKISGGRTIALDDRFLVTPKGLYLKQVRNEDAGEYQVTLINDANTIVETVELEISKFRFHNKFSW